MNILITGGAGYIGSFATNALLDKGNKVLVVDSLERGHRDSIDKRAEFIEGDIEDKNILDNLLNKQNFDAIMHFAGYISMEESMKDPGLYFYNNIYGALSLIEKAVKNNIKKFIFSSTAGVYGNPIKIPIPEDHPTSPTNPYGESKLMVEKMLSWYQKIHGINFVSLRYFNAAGASLDGTFGEDHSPETHIIPLAISAAIENKEFRLYGTDYDTPDGTCIRDYIHVLDLVDAHILALDKIGKDNGGFIYNVGTGKGHSNREVIKIVQNVSGVNLNIKDVQRRSGDAYCLVADSTRIQKELGFKPRYSDLETIINSAWGWHKKNAKFSAKGGSASGRKI